MKKFYLIIYLVVKKVRVYIVDEKIFFLMNRCDVFGVNDKLVDKLDENIIICCLIWIFV